MKQALSILLVIAVIVAVRYKLFFGHHDPAQIGSPALVEPHQSLSDARRQFQTKLTQQIREEIPPAKPPAGMFRLVNYLSPAGELAAYVSPDPLDGKKHPAIIWVVGGFDSSIDSGAWDPAPASNDQSGSAFRKAGIMMMYPSFRGGNQNAGVKEGFYGEVDDLLAAADFLSKQPGVDPSRIYLGGHSTGGTLALLTAECSNRFRAVFCFGPVADVSGYGSKALPFNIGDLTEVRLRSPGYWLSSIQNPVYIFEGTGRGNADSVRWMQQRCQNPKVQFHLVEGATHFTILSPVSKLIARQIVQDTGPDVNFSFNDVDLSSALNKAR